MEITLTADMYDETVTHADGVVLIDFWATWCGPCRMIAPVIAEIAAEHPEIKVCKVNVDSEKALAQRFGIMSIPTVVVIKNGEIKNRSIGVTGKSAIMDMLK